MYSSKPAIGGTHENASSVRDSMSKGVTACVSSFAPRRASRGSECYADSRVGFRGVAPSTVTRKDSPIAPENLMNRARTHEAAHEKKKAPGPCELRALLRDAPSSPYTRHGRRRITGHHRTLRSDNAGYARALDRAHNLTSLLATRSESLPIASRRVTTATPVPGNWTSCMAG